MMKRIALPILGLALLQCSRCTKGPTTATTNAEKKVNEGKMEGNVFLVTNDGDLKPARFANVRLWRGYHGIIALIMDGPLFQTPEFQAQCRNTLVEAARDQLGEAAGYQKDSLLIGEIDELGNFVFEKLQPAKYTVDVFGHGGMNAALWESKEVEVQAGESTKIKMGKPMNSCFDPNHAVPF
jgi:hypothetical protein